MRNTIEKEQLNLSGIYQIRNIVNNKIYIGSAYNLYNRYRTHKSTLKNNKHDNEHLQRSYNKYGEDSFVFELIELVNIEYLYKIEEDYIVKNIGNKCYNMRTVNINPLIEYNKTKLKKFKLVDCNNIIYDLEGYTKASKILGLKMSSIRALVIGAIKSHKGWRLLENIDYSYKDRNKIKGKGAKIHNIKLLSPDGIIYENIYNIEEFCRVHTSIQPSNIFAIVSGKTRYCNGWSLYRGTLDQPLEKNAKEYDIILVSPDGKIYDEIKNLNKFCKKHDIAPSCIRDLIKGKVKKKSHKGWMLYKDYISKNKK